MVKVISQQNLLEEIISSSKKIFEKNLTSNSNAFSYDDELYDRRFYLKTKDFLCLIHRYEHPHEEPYYNIQFKLFYDMDPGFNRGSLLIHNAFGKADFYIDDEDCGRVNEYDEEKVNNCFNVIYKVLSYLAD